MGGRVGGEGEVPEHAEGAGGGGRRRRWWRGVGRGDFIRDDGGDAARGVGAIDVGDGAAADGGGAGAKSPGELPSCPPRGLALLGGRRGEVKGAQLQMAVVGEDADISYASVPCAWSPPGATHRPTRRLVPHHKGQR